ncbi:HIR complex subunit [Coemansia sp. RSA 1250]|nr:HIR complex subunit [Coemansia sp. RSA 1250]
MRITKPSWLHHDADKKTQTAIFSVDFDASGERLATGGMDNKVRLWSTHAMITNEEPKLLATLAAHSGAVMCVRFAHGQRRRQLATGADDMVVLIWEQDTSTDYSDLGAGSLSGGNEIWRPVRRLTGHASDVCDIAWSPGNRFLASCGLDNRVLIWDMHTYERVAELTAHSQFVKGVTFDPAGKYLATQSDDKTMRVWRTSDWAEHATISAPFMDNIFSTYFRRPSWSPDGDCVAAANAANGRVPVAAIVQRTTGWPTDLSFVGHHAAIEVVRFNPRVFSSNGTTASVCAAAGQDRGVSIWLTSQPVPIAASTGLFTGSVFDLAWHSPENLEGDDPVVARLAACSFDGTVALLEFTQSELGKPIPVADQGALLAAHGCTRPVKNAHTLSELYASDNDSAEYGVEDGSRHPQPIAETVEQMRLEARHQESREARISQAIETVVAAPSEPASQAVAESKPAEESPPKPQEAETKQQTEPQAMPVPVRTKDGRKRVAPVFIRPLGRASSSTPNTTAVKSQVKVSTGQPPAADPPRVLLDQPLWIESRVLTTQQNASKQNSEDDNQTDAVASVSSLSTQSIAHAQAAAMPRVQLAIPQVVAQLESHDNPAISVAAYNQQEQRVRLTCMQNSWTAHLGGSACIAVAASNKVAAAGMADGSVHWFDSSSGARLAPPLMAEAPAVVLRCTAQYCLWLNAVGQLTVFDTDAMRAVIEQTSIAPLLYSTDKAPALTGVQLTETGACAVQLSNGQAFAFDQRLRLWLRIADPYTFEGSDFSIHPHTKPIGTSGNFKAYARTATAGSKLEAIQESALLQHHRTISDKEQKTLPRSVRGSVTLEHLEHQLLAAAAIDSHSDIERFVDLLAQRLAQAGDTKRTAYWLSMLLGPPLANGLTPESTSWTACLGTLPKRKLLQQRVLPALSTNRHLQSLVTEYSSTLSSLLQ